MIRTLKKKLYPFVIKPGRYTGGEPGQIVKDPAGRVKYLHIYPDKYEVGQSYVGLQSIYHVINSDDRFLCERAFAVDRDAEEVMRREKIPMFSLESSRPLFEFDAVGFTLSYELVYTNVLCILDLAGIPLFSKDRGDDHPIIIAGGPAVYNPEPMAGFIDIFFIGDAEEGLPEILAVLGEMKDGSRSEKLSAVCRKVDSVYIPQYYDDNRKPVNDFAPPEIKARLIGDLSPDYYPDHPIVPMIDTVHSHMSVEIMRGCPRGCRFCQAGPIYRPVRVRSQNDILQQVEKQIQYFGYDEISLLSLSTSDYPNIEELAMKIARRYEKQRISVSLPALRPGTITPQLLDAASKVRKSGLTIAPEAGTERLRMFIRKDFPDQAVFDTTRLAFEKGWTTLKLYFMLGLPTETDEDLLGIIDLVSKIYAISRDYPGRKTINITLSPFAPKPHTPFQWDEILPIAEVLRRVNLIRKHNTLKNVNFKHHNVENSILQGVIGRGDRRIGQVILKAYEKGCRFDGWKEEFTPDKWFAAFEEAGIMIEEKLKPIPFTADLPWSHIRKGVSVEHLQKERERSARQMADYKPLLFGLDDSAGNSDHKLEYGRGKKKAILRNLAAPTKNRVRIRWGKSDIFRYLSHLDNMRFMERAIRRSRIPVDYSQGYNPSMKLSFGPPLPLGFTSEAEFLDITLDTTLMPYMIDNLKKAMPDGITLFEARPVLKITSSLSALLNRAVYTIPLQDFDSTDHLEKRIGELFSSDRLEVDRIGKDSVKKVNIRPALYDIYIKNDKLWLVLGMGDGGYARPLEVVELLDGDRNIKYLAFCLHRQEVYRQDEDRKIGALDL